MILLSFIRVLYTSAEELNFLWKSTLANLGAFGRAKPTRNKGSHDSPQPGTSKVERKGVFAIVPYLPGTGNQVRRTTDDVVQILDNYYLHVLHSILRGTPLEDGKVLLCTSFFRNERVSDHSEDPPTCQGVFTTKGYCHSWTMAFLAIEIGCIDVMSLWFL